jgi:hypothetical protein
MDEHGVEVNHATLNRRAEVRPVVASSAARASRGERWVRSLPPASAGSGEGAETGTVQVAKALRRLIRNGGGGLRRDQVPVPSTATNWKVLGPLWNQTGRPFRH